MKLTTGSARLEQALELKRLPMLQAHLNVSKRSVLVVVRRCRWSPTIAPKKEERAAC